ncbi:MAG: ABC transporter permease [Christensenellales bacterium]|nr:ABC transporter permease subunit [Oscillospiraceae bacterium]
MKRVTKLRKIFRRDWQLYVFMLIPLIWVIIFCYAPMFGAQIAFRKYQPRLGIWDSPWVGFYQFKKFFNSYQFSRVMMNTVVISLYTILCSFPLPIIFALVLNSTRSHKFRTVTQTIVTMPHFISVVVLVGILLQIFNSRTGVYGTLMESITGAYPEDLFSKPANFRHMYVWSGVWQQFGWNSIVYIAALAAVSPELHEAAQIDGASRFQRMLHVDFPAILPTITIMLILRMGSVMTIGFEKVYLMQNSLNLTASEIISTYVYKVGLSSAGTTDLSYSTAIGLFNSAINLVLISVTNFIARKLDGNGLW